MWLYIVPFVHIVIFGPFCPTIRPPGVFVPFCPTIRPPGVPVYWKHRGTVEMAVAIPCHHLHLSLVQWLAARVHVPSEVALDEFPPFLTAA